MENEEFLAKMAIDGRLTVPKLIMRILAEKSEKVLTGSVFEVMISPVGELTKTLASDAAAHPENDASKMLDRITNIRRNWAAQALDG